MLLHTLWRRVDDEQLPIAIDIVDEYTIEESGIPEGYAANLRDVDVRELILNVPTKDVRALFSSPVIKASAHVETKAHGER